MRLLKPSYNSGIYTDFDVEFTAPTAASFADTFEANSPFIFSARTVQDGTQVCNDVIAVSTNCVDNQELRQAHRSILKNYLKYHDRYSRDWIRCPDIETIKVDLKNDAMWRRFEESHTSEIALVIEKKKTKERNAAPFHAELTEEQKQKLLALKNKIDNLLSTYKNSTEELHKQEKEALEKCKTLLDKFESNPDVIHDIMRDNLDLLHPRESKPPFAVGFFSRNMGTLIAEVASYLQLIQDDRIELESEVLRANKVIAKEILNNFKKFVIERTQNNPVLNPMALLFLYRKFCEEKILSGEDPALYQSLFMNSVMKMSGPDALVDIHTKNFISYQKTPIGKIVAGQQELKRNTATWVPRPQKTQRDESLLAQENNNTPTDSEPPVVSTRSPR